MLGAQNTTRLWPGGDTQVVVSHLPPAERDPVVRQVDAGDRGSGDEIDLLLGVPGGECTRTDSDSRCRA